MATLNAASSQSNQRQQKKATYHKPPDWMNARKHCDQCTHTWETKEGECPQCGCRDFALYMPTQEEIRVATLAIQAKWSDEERQKRSRWAITEEPAPAMATVRGWHNHKVVRIDVGPA